MNILILGSGGREHTLAWKVKQSPKCDKLYVAPGNGGTSSIATNLEIDIRHFKEVAQAIKEHEVGFLIVGPEEPLVNGIVDFLETDTELKGLKIVGPTAEGAQLEGSKQFAKDFMDRHDIPTAKAKVITEENLEEGHRFMECTEPPYVLKADGLAGGKGSSLLKNWHMQKRHSMNW